MIYKINEKYSELENFVKSLASVFDTEGECVYEGRNIIKIFRVNNYVINVKSFKVPHIVNKFAYAYIRGSKAKHSYEYALRLNKSESITPDPIAYVETFKNALLNRSYYVSIHLDYDFTIRDLIGFSWPDKEEVLKQFARFTYNKLHLNDVHHLDYSRGNILISKKDGLYDFSVVDINRMRFENMHYLKGLRNFAHIWASADELSIVAKEYARLCGQDEDKAVALLIEFDAQHKKKIEKKKLMKRKFRGK